MDRDISRVPLGMHTYGHAFICYLLALLLPGPCTPHPSMRKSTVQTAIQTINVSHQCDLLRGRQLEPSCQQLVAQRQVQAEEGRLVLLQACGRRRL